MKRQKKIIYIASGIIAVLAILAVVFALNANQILSTLGLIKTSPAFSFNASQAPGWWAADNYDSKTAAESEEYKGNEPIDTLPSASINAFQGEEGEYTTACFVMLAYYDYSVDVAQLKKDKESGYAADGSGKSLGESNASVNIFGETKNFTLTNYELVGPDSENAMQGMSYGWIDLGDQHVSVNGVCPTGAELDDMIPAIQALSLTKK